MQVSMSETRKKFPLSEKKIWKKTIGGNLIGIIFLFGLNYFVGILNKLNNNDLNSLINPIAILISVCVFISLITQYFYQRWYYATYFYDLTDDYVIIKKNPITPHEITIPYERIQDIYIDQDLLDRFFGLYDVHLSTATVSSGMEAHIDGVKKPAADGLRSVLLETVHKKISQHKPQASNSSLKNV